jgi:hypothetical protein
MTFRATTTILQEVTVRGGENGGTVVNVRAVFVEPGTEGSQGVIHGTVNHSLAAPSLPAELQEQLRAFHAGVLAYIDSMHFVREAERKIQLRDIAEAVSEKDDPADDIARPG